MAPGSGSGYQRGCASRVFRVHNCSFFDKQAHRFDLPEPGCCHQGRHSRQGLHIRLRPLLKEKPQQRESVAERGGLIDQGAAIRQFCVDIGAALEQ